METFVGYLLEARRVHEYVIKHLTPILAKGLSKKVPTFCPTRWNSLSTSSDTSAAPDRETIALWYGFPYASVSAYMTITSLPHPDTP